MIKSRFEIPTLSTLKIVKASNRKEHHGDVLVLAEDLRLGWNTHQSALDMFDADLLPSLMINREAEARAKAGQGKLDLPVGDRPNIRFPYLPNPMKWEQEYSGYTLRIKWGVNDDTDIVLKVCQLKRFEFELIEGGSVYIEFSLSSSADVTGAATGLLAELEKTDVTAMLTGPLVTDDADLIDASKDGDAPGTEKAKEKATKKSRGATDEFIAAHGTAATH